MRPRIFKAGHTWTLLYTKKAQGPVVVPTDSFSDAWTRYDRLNAAGYVYHMRAGRHS